MMGVARKYKILGCVSLIWAVLDQFTKWIVLDRFHYGESLELIPGFFNLTHVRNTGAAFGLLAQAEPWIRIPLFILIPILALFAIGSLFKKLPAESIRLSFALSSVVGGAIGNLIDRVRLGFVVDFLDFHWKSELHYPAFNVADIAICIGVGLLLLDLFFVQNSPLSETSESGQSRKKA